MRTTAVRIGLILLLAAFTFGCTATPERAIPEPGIVFDQSIDDTRRAALDALVVFGFEIKEETDTYVEGRRPRKIGFFVGSGGEAVGVWLNSLTPERTSVKVDTAKTFVGGAGQKDFDDEIIAEMRKSLGQ